jgi:hypothetical protein
VASGFVDHLGEDGGRDDIPPLADGRWDKVTKSGLGRFNDNTIT